MGYHEFRVATILARISAPLVPGPEQMVPTCLTSLRNLPLRNKPLERALSIALEFGPKKHPVNSCFSTFCTVSISERCWSRGRSSMPIVSHTLAARNESRTTTRNHRQQINWQKRLPSSRKTGLYANNLESSVALTRFVIFCSSYGEANRSWAILSPCITPGL